jgi:hypothetical protein
MSKSIAVKCKHCGNFVPVFLSTEEGYATVDDLAAVVELDTLSDGSYVVDFYCSQKCRAEDLS